MFKLKKVKGFSLLEVICSISIFAIIFIYIINLELRDIKLNKYNDNTSKAIEFIEALKNNIVYKYEYEEIKDIFNAHSNEDLGDKLYINKNNANIKALENINLTDIISKENNGSIFIEIFIGNIDENVIEINLKLNMNSSIDCNCIETKIYKGDY